MDLPLNATIYKLMTLYNYISFLSNKINYKEMVRSVFAILPGISAVLITGNKVFLLASFFSMICIMPVGVSFRKIVYPQIMLLIIYPASILFSLEFPYSAQIFWIFIFLLSIILGYVEANIGNLKKLNSWIFIGLLYGVAEIKSKLVNISPELGIMIYVLALLGITLYFLFPEKKKEKMLLTLTFERNEIVHYVKYFAYFVCALIIYIHYRFEQYQWFFWSGLSVLSLEFNNSKIKIRKRLVAGSFGIGIGAIAIFLIAAIGDYPVLSFVGILLSLKAFRNYELDFSTRCFFIVLFAGNQAFHSGYTRMIDVFAGGALGVAVSLILSFFDKKIHPAPRTSS